MAIIQAATPVQGHAKYERLIADATQVPPATTVVVHPCDESSLRGAVEAAEAGIIVPILVQVPLYVLPTDEELMIGRHTLTLLAGHGADARVRAAG